jgi:hypothetical protein
MGLKALAGIVAACLVSAAPADRPPEPKAEATLVVTGTVGKVYANTDLENINYIVEIRIETVEKGAGFKAGDIVDVRCFQRKESAPLVPAAHGHQDLPKEGERIRAYLNLREGNIYEGAYPSWIDRLPAQAREQTGTRIGPEEARKALIAMVEASDDDVLKFGLDRLKRDQVVHTGKETIMIGKWHCDLRKAIFVLSLASDAGLAEYTGVFQKGEGGRWRAIITQRKQT